MQSVDNLFDLDEGELRSTILFSCYGQEATQLSRETCKLQLAFFERIKLDLLKVGEDRELKVRYILNMWER